MSRAKKSLVRFTGLALLAAIWFAAGSQEPSGVESPSGLQLVRGPVREPEPAPPALDPAHGHLHGHEGSELGCCVSAAASYFTSDAPDRLVPLGSLRDRGRAAVDVEVARGQVLFRIAEGSDEAAVLAAVERGFGVRPASLGGLGFYALDGGAKTDLPAALARIEAVPGVAYAEPNYTARPADSSGSTRCTGDRLGSANCPNHDTIRLHEALAIATLRGRVKVAVLDTGLDLEHEDLQGHVAGFAADLVNDDDAPEDILGHGTAIAGIIAATSGNELGASGICQSAEIIGIKIADSRGVATFANLVRGILLAVEQGARIINLSLGSRADSQALRDAVRFARERGVLVVAPTGNDNTNLEMIPARYDEVLSVAGTGPDGDLAITTSLGFATDVAAPGENLITTAPGHLYSTVSGTSCSTAVASGAAAVIFSVNPELTGDQVASILRRTARTIPAVEGQMGILEFGRIDLEAAVRQAASDYVDAGIVEVRLRPESPRAGQTVKASVRVANLGNRPTEATGATFGVPLLGAAGPRGGAPGRQDVAPLAVGEDRWVEFETQVQGPTTLSFALEGIPGDAIPENDRREIAIETTDRTVRNLSIAGFRFADESLEAGRIRFAVVVENRGNAVEAGGLVSVKVTGDREYHADQAYLHDLLPGATEAPEFAWEIPAETPAEKLGIEISISTGVEDEKPEDDRAEYTFFLSAPDAEKARLQYQQGEDIDIIGDAPFRVESSRSYVPVMIFVPDNGGRGRERYLEFQDTKIRYLKNPTDAGTVLYHDRYGAPPAFATPGLALVDEDGKALPTLDIFKGERLTERGRHNIFRVPLAAIDVPANLNAPAARFIQVEVQWKFHRKIFWFFSWVKRGTYRVVLRVLVSPFPLPQLPSGGQYYDAHHHTIAEWFHGDPFRIFAEKKAYGGPVQMIKESGWAIGLIQNPEDIKDKVITTDHNCFFWNRDNPGQPETNPDRRPPFGPTSPSRSLRPDGTVKTEWERYVDLFGVGSGEEVSFAQGQGFGIFPMGAHMLSHWGQHFDGPWHGGSEFARWIGEGGPLYLDEVLNGLAKQNRGENRRAFAYAAHPLSGQGWSDENLDRALGLSEKFRTDRYVHVEGTDFVFKGFQVMNGRGARHLDSSEIDFDNLNPWANPKWQQGASKWDTEAQDTLARWHESIATNMDYWFAGAKDRRFTRKVFAEAGTDAHGDFNFGTGRLATLLKFSLTYAVDSTAWGMVRTYAIPDGKAGATQGERFMQAMADGNTVLSDGPLAVFDMDAEGRFDSDRLSWHDRRLSYENTEGRIGGDGAFDGGRTMLARKGSPGLVFRYWYTNTPEFGTSGGQITHVKIYRDEAGKPNPVKTYETPFLYFFKTKHQQPLGVGSLAPAAKETWLTESIDPAQEGLVNVPSAFSIGAFTGPDPDQNDIGPDDYRCYTNPVYVVPVDIRAQVLKTSGAVIPPGGLQVELAFPLSMSPSDPLIEVKVLDANGDSTDGSYQPISGTRGAWSSPNGITNSLFTAWNTNPVPLTGPDYPVAGKITLVVYTRVAPRDLFGNGLNPVATTLTLAQGGSGGGGSGGGGPGAGPGAPGAGPGAGGDPGADPGDPGSGTTTGGNETGSGTTPSSGGTSTSDPAPSTPSTPSNPSTSAPVSSAPATSSSSPSSPSSTNKPKSQKKDDGLTGISGCFIATASYDEAEGTEPVVDASGTYRLSASRKRDLDTLRDFRDEWLLDCEPGRELVSLYYEHGPTAARWISENPWAKGPVRILLAPAVLGAKILLGRAPLETVLLAFLATLALFRRRTRTSPSRFPGDSPSRRALF